MRGFVLWRGFAMTLIAWPLSEELAAGLWYRALSMSEALCWWFTSHEREDIAGEALTALLAKLARRERVDDPVAWLCGALLKIRGMRARRKRREVQLSDAGWDSRQSRTDDPWATFEELLDNVAPHLCEADKEVLRWLAQGATRKSLALTLGVSPDAAERKIKKLLDRLRFSRRSSNI